MSEMLANQYFMARNFSEAETEFLQCLTLEPGNMAARKKLIICNIQTGHLTEALVNFLILLHKDINLIIDTAKLRDDCPCPKIINHIEEVNENPSRSIENLIALGILWLYCDRFKSEEYFHLAQLACPSDIKITEAYSIIKKFNDLNKSMSYCKI